MLQRGSADANGPRLLARRLSCSRPPRAPGAGPRRGRSCGRSSLGDDPYAGGQHRGIDIGGKEGEPCSRRAPASSSSPGSCPRAGRRSRSVRRTATPSRLSISARSASRKGARSRKGDPIGTLGTSGDAGVGRALRAPRRPSHDDDPNGYVDPLRFLPPGPAPEGRSPAPAAARRSGQPPVTAAPPPPRRPLRRRTDARNRRRPPARACRSRRAAQPTVRRRLARPTSTPSADRRCTQLAGRPPSRAATGSGGRRRPRPRRGRTEAAAFQPSRRRGSDVSARARAVARRCRQPDPDAESPAATSCAASRGPVPVASPVIEAVPAPGPRSPEAVRPVPDAERRSRPNAAVRLAVPRAGAAAGAVPAARAHPRPLGAGARRRSPQGRRARGLARAAVAAAAADAGRRRGRPAAARLSSLAMRFYLTTPIYYVNSTPAHRARVHDDRGRHPRPASPPARRRDVLPHGRGRACGRRSRGSPTREGLTPQEYADRSSAPGASCRRRIDAEPTSSSARRDDGHKRFVRDFLQRIYDNGDVYEDVYAGCYCVGCEAFKKRGRARRRQVPGPRAPRPSSSRRRTTSSASRPTRSALLALYDERPDFVLPHFRATRRAASSRAACGTSRSAAQAQPWGIPLPWDESQVAYVWADALVNYLSALTYARPGRTCASVSGRRARHLHGEGHPPLPLRLLAGDAACRPGTSVPQQLFVHGYLLIDEQKISKSLGNVIDPLDLVDVYGADAVRFWAIRAVSFGQDGTSRSTSSTSGTSASSANDLGQPRSRGRPR